MTVRVALHFLSAEVVMSRFWFAVATFGIVLAVSGPARADDAADARKIIEKAVRARGGREKLEKLPGRVVTFKGTVHSVGDGIAMNGTVSTQGADKQRIDVEVDVGGIKAAILIVYAGDKGWRKSDLVSKDVVDFSKDRLAEIKEFSHAWWVATLVPLTDKQFTLATVGEIKVDNKSALGVKMSRKGYSDVDLYCDKETGLLVKTERRMKDEMSGQEVNEKAFFGDYKEVQGTKQSHKFSVKRDRKLYFEFEATKIELFEKPDASTFAKP